MTKNRILRSPDVSNNTVTLKSSYLNAIDRDSTTASEALLNIGSTDSLYIDDTPAIDKNLLNEVDIQALSDHLKAMEAELKSEKDNLELSFSQLEEKEKKYRDEIYNDLKVEIINEVKSEYKAREQQLTELIESITNKINSGIDSVEEEVIAIVFESVCKIIGDQMNKSESITSVVREVIKHSQDRLEMILRVSTKDYDLLKGTSDLISIGVNNRIEIVADEHVRYGGCIVETVAGRIDGRLEQQLNSLLQLLLRGQSQA